MKKATLLYFSKKETHDSGVPSNQWQGNIRRLEKSLTQNEYIQLLNDCETELVVLIDGDRLPLAAVNNLMTSYERQVTKGQIGYYTTPSGKIKKWICNLWHSDKNIMDSAVLIGRKADLQKAYIGNDLAQEPLVAAGYSLQKQRGIRFVALEAGDLKVTGRPDYYLKDLVVNYSLRVPCRYILSGDLFKKIFTKGEKVQRDMVCRMLVFLFACFTFVYMPYISRDYGVTGDEFVDHRHAGYVLDYFAKGDTTAISQPKTALHLYGNVVQVVAAAVCDWFHIDNFYEARHFIGALVGAVGVLFTGLMGLRFGGGLCGLLAILLMFFTPRYFGHSMNNLKDAPFAVGYIVSIFYTVRLMDYYPVFRLRHIVGLALGLGLALGTRSGGLILYPMMFMYAGFFYISQHGLREFYKFGKYGREIGRILIILFIAGAVGYLLAIILWPFALQKPLSNVLFSLQKFTNYSVGLRTIFDGEQMMSNMLLWKYAPKYLMIGMPLVTVLGFVGSLVYFIFRRKDFSLIAYFLFFSAIFPVVWVIYKNSNLYGGIRHLLFVMPAMVVIAAWLWSRIMRFSCRYVKIFGFIIFAGLFALPVTHYIRNHPNEYVYFNELVGGVKGSYGNYETDYYFNSLKESADWLKKNVELTEGEKIRIATQHAEILTYYFRKHPDVQVIYTRYYEKYAKDWDYAILGNVYVSRYQLQHGLFPPEGTLYTPLVDGLPMSAVVKRQTKDDLAGFEMERAGNLEGALAAFRKYTQTYKNNEEAWARMGRSYFLVGQDAEALACLDRALELHPSLNEALYISALVAQRAKDYKKVMEITRQMLAENSMSVDAYYLQALAFYDMKKYKEAVDKLNSVLKFRPNYDRALILAGDIFKDNQDYEKAAQMYDRAFKMAKSVNTLVDFADMQARMKKFQFAEELLQNAMEVQPSYAPIYNVKARMCLMQGNAKEALRFLDMVRENQNDPEFFVLYAIYYQLLNDKASMQIMLENALALDDGNTEALRLKKGL